MNILVVGAGAWGTALAISFAARHTVTLWARDATQRRQLSATRSSMYLPTMSLPAAVNVAEDFDAALAQSELVLAVTPTAGLRPLLRQICAARRDYLSLPIIWACKGFEQESAALPHQIVANELGSAARCGALSGPSFALEVARGLPTAVTLAALDARFAMDTAHVLHQARFRVYFSTDLIGVEVGGAVKNVMAIATGIADGLGMGLNARAALITRGLAELTRLGIALGGKAETFMGLSGAGDLILTCTGDLSRNRRVGLMLAEGQTLNATLHALGHVAEGVHTVQSVAQIAQSLGIEMPITEAVAAVLFGGIPARAAVERLLARDPRSE